MKNKRLLAILLVFIVLGTLAIVGGTVFVVRSVDIRFVSDTEYFDDENAAIIRLEESVSFIKGKNILFNVDRERIKSEIEETDVRVIVANIEAKFPNKLEIKLRERYPTFKYTDAISGRTVMMDACLRILTDIVPPELELIDISNQVAVDITLADAEPGDYLYDFLEEMNNDSRDSLRSRRLVDLTELFAARENNEDSIRHLFTKMEYTEIRGDLDLILTMRNPVDPNDKIVIEIRDVEERFNEKLTYIWYVLEEKMEHQSGRYLAYTNPQNGKLNFSFIPD